MRLLLLLGILLIVCPVHGAMLFYGVPNYSVAIVPANGYVHQMDNITQNVYYDLSGIYGFSGRVAHWDSDDAVGYVYPDQVVFLDKPEHMYIDPAKFHPGRWFQYDPESTYCTDDKAWCGNSFGRGNSYVFYVVENKSAYESPAVVTVTVTAPRVTLISFDINGSQSIEMTNNNAPDQNYTQIVVPTPIDPVPVYTITLQPIETTEEITTEATPLVVDNSAPEIPIVTPKAPLSAFAAISALAVILWRRT